MGDASITKRREVGAMLTSTFRGEGAGAWAADEGVGRREPTQRVRSVPQVDNQLAPRRSRECLGVPSILQAMPRTQSRLEIMNG